MPIGTFACTTALGPGGAAGKPAAKELAGSAARWIHIKNQQKSIDKARGPESRWCGLQGSRKQAARGADLVFGTYGPMLAPLCIFRRLILSWIRKDCKDQRLIF